MTTQANESVVAAALDWKTRAKSVFSQAWSIIKRRPILWACLLVLPPVFGQFFTMTFNISPSLPYSWCFIVKGAPVKQGDLVAYLMREDPYKQGQLWVKIVAGAAGDVVTEKDREFFINGVSVGRAKERGKKGQVLHNGPVGVIGPGQYYVMAPHKDSLDSRYSLTGWVNQREVVGRAYVIF